MKKGRTDPVQAEIVRLVKTSPLGLVTAAIGDGGNDVSMIQVLLSSLPSCHSSPLQEAHVGLGIIGREGRAAVRAADFAFTKFRFLQKVILKTLEHLEH